MVPKTGLTPIRSRPPRCGVDGQQRSYREEWGWLGAPSNTQRLFVRRMTLPRPGEDGLILVTDLLKAEQFPAGDLLETYRLRWSIERVFQQVTEVFHLKRLISSSPQDTIFQCAFCMVLYNLIQVTRGYLAAAQQRASATISSELLFYDIHRELIAWHTLAERSQLSLPIPRFRTEADLIPHLTHLLSRRMARPLAQVTPQKEAEING